MQRATIEISRLKAAKRAVEAQRLPAVNGLIFTGKQLNGQNKGNLALLPGVFQPITQQYRLSLQLSEANLDLQMAQQKLRLAKQSAVAEAKKTYMAMVAITSEIAAREQNLAFLNELENYTAAEVNKGAALKVDLMVVQARKAKAEYELDKDRDILETTGQTLNRLLDRPVKTAIVVRQEQSGNQDIDSAEALKLALANRPEIALLRLGIARSSKERRVENSRYIPDISFGATAIYSRNLDISLPRNFLSVGFLGLWEPWDWGRRYQVGMMAEQTGRERKVELSDLQDRISVEVDNDRREVGVARKGLTAAHLLAKSQEELLRITTRRYKVGAAVIKDLSDAQASYMEAVSESARAESALASSEIELDRAMGVDFD
ncbi:MAG: TolC family protein [Cyanobacteria bacterium SZAS LIN-3]|nr:TolC family protein [Cyanobacteria bacterium SZAS LIN-3]